MKTFIIEATFEDCNKNQQSIIIGKTLAKDSIEAYENMCNKYKNKNEYEIARLHNDGNSVHYVEFFYHDLDEMETI